MNLQRQSATFFSRTLQSYDNRMHANGFRPDWTRRAIRVLERFAAFARRYPPFWEAAHFDAYCAARLPVVQRSTLRRDQNVIAQYCAFLRDGDYEFYAQAQRLFGRGPAQIVTDGNRIHHDHDAERRPLSLLELQAFFAHSDARALELHGACKKGAPCAARDNALYKVMLAYGVRDQEVRGLDILDWSAVPDIPQFGAFGSVFIREGKATAGGSARTRTVYTVPLFDWILPVLEKYLADVRPLFERGDPRAMFVTERGTRLARSTICARFAELRDASLESTDVSAHNLRHTYNTMLAQHGYNEHFRQGQLGHTNPSSTEIYTHYSPEYQRLVIKNFLRHSYAP